MRPTDYEMCARTAEELRRLDKTPCAIANLVGCKHQLVRYWLSGEGVPCAAYLKRLHEIGCDILYIITGERKVEDG